MRNLPSLPQRGRVREEALAKFAFGHKEETVCVKISAGVVRQFDICRTPVGQASPKFKGWSLQGALKLTGDQGLLCALAQAETMLLRQMRSDSAE